MHNLNFLWLLLIGLSCSHTLWAQASQLAATSVKSTSIGIVLANKRVILSAESMGRVIQIHFDEGQLVKKGDQLFSINDAKLRADFAANKASVALAKADLAHTKRKVERIQRLYKSHTVSKEKVEDVEYQRDAAKAKLAIAIAELNKAKAILADSKVKAPFSGIIIKRLVEVGQIIQIGSELFILEDQQQLKFQTQIKEQDINRINLGDQMDVTIDALDVTLPGTVKKIITSADQTTHSFRIEILLPTKAGLYPGMFGKTTFVIK